MRNQITLLAVAIALLGMVSIALAQTECYEFDTAWGSCGTGDSQFGTDIGPRGIDDGDSANIFVCDYGNLSIKEFTSSGGFVSSCASGYNSDIVHDNGYIYFTRPFGEVCKYTAGCQHVWTIPIATSGWNLNGICMDSEGILHVCEGYSSAVYKIDPVNGDIISSYAVPTGCWQIAADAAGHVYITSGSGAITRYTNGGTYDGITLNFPMEERADCIEVDGFGNVYMGTADCFIKKYNSNLDTLLAQWGGYGSQQGQFTHPSGIAVDDRGYVYVSDGGGAGCEGMNRRIQVFRPCAPAPDLVASFTETAPVIDGVIDATEWQHSQTYNLVFHSNVDQTTATIPVYLLNDGTFLYCASTVPFPSTSTAYFGVYIDGDHSHSINGDSLEPHVDMGYNKAGTDSPLYPIYDAYWAEVPPPGVVWPDMVTPPVGAEHAYSGSSELSYEFKIPLSDITAAPGKIIGIHLQFSPGSWTYMYPSADYGDIAGWADLLLGYMGGDANNDGSINIADAVFLINYIFKGGPVPVPPDAGDPNADCAVNIADPVYLINYIFKGGPEPQLGCVPNPAASSGEGDVYNKPALRDGQTLTCHFDGTKTMITVGGTVDIYGLQLEVTDAQDVMVTSLVEDMQVFSGKVGDVVRIGLLDLAGVGHVAAGQSTVLEITGEAMVVSALGADETGNAFGIAVTSAEKVEILPREFALGQNRPNPFNPSTEISFSMPAAGQVRLEVFNIVGQRVATLVEGWMEAGEHTAVWDGSNVPSGVYLYRLETGEFSATRKMVLIK